MFYQLDLNFGELLAFSVENQLDHKNLQFFKWQNCVSAFVIEGVELVRCLLAQIVYRE